MVKRQYNFRSLEKFKTYSDFGEPYKRKGIRENVSYNRISK